jgi:hypothetical protein
VADSKTASACSLVKYDFALDFHEKYRLVNFSERYQNPAEPELRKQYSRPGLYDIQTSKLLWHTYNFPIDSDIHLSSDGVYMIQVDLRFLPTGLFFYKNGLIVKHYGLDFFGAIIPKGGGDCYTIWVNSNRFDEAEGKFYLVASDKKTYVFDFRTGQLLEKIVPTTATATALPKPTAIANNPKSVSTSPSLGDFVVIWSIVGVVGLLSLLMGAKFYSKKVKGKQR